MCDPPAIQEFVWSSRHSDWSLSVDEPLFSSPVIVARTDTVLLNLMYLTDTNHAFFSLHRKNCWVRESLM